MQMPTALHAEVARNRAETMPETSVAVSAASPVIDGRIGALAQSAGVRIAAEGAKYDILLLAVDSSSIPHLLEAASDRANVCAIWIDKRPSRSIISRLLRAGVNGILSLEATAEQLQAALKAIHRGLQVLDPIFTREEAPNHQEAQADFVPEELTDREQQVLAMMAEGLSNKEISSRLTISTHTVKFHISSILGKLAATSRTEAVSIGIRSGRIAI